MYTPGGAATTAKGIGTIGDGHSENCEGQTRRLGLFACFCVNTCIADKQGVEGPPSYNRKRHPRNQGRLKLKKQRQHNRRHQKRQQRQPQCQRRQSRKRQRSQQSSRQRQQRQKKQNPRRRRRQQSSQQRRQRQRKQSRKRRRRQQSSQQSSQQRQHQQRKESRKRFRRHQDIQQRHRAQRKQSRHGRQKRREESSLQRSGCKPGLHYLGGVQSPMIPLQLDTSPSSQKVKSPSLRMLRGKPTRKPAHHHRMRASGGSPGHVELPHLDGVGKTGSGGECIGKNTVLPQRKWKGW